MTAEEEFFGVDVVQTDGTAQVAVRGEVDVATAPRLWDAIDGVDGDTRELVIDMSELTFMDSTGIRVLIRAHELLRSRGGRIVVRAPEAGVRKLLEVTSVDRVIEIE